MVSLPEEMLSALKDDSIYLEHKNNLIYYLCIFWCKSIFIQGNGILFIVTLHASVKFQFTSQQERKPKCRKNLHWHSLLAHIELISAGLAVHGLSWSLSYLQDRKKWKKHQHRINTSLSAAWLHIVSFLKQANKTSLSKRFLLGKAWRKTECWCL